MSADEKGTDAIPASDPKAENDEKDSTEAGGQQPLSKRAMKKMAKRQQWLDTKAERRAAEKAKKKAKIARLREVRSVLVRRKNLW